MGGKTFPERPVSLAEQIAVMKLHFPNFHLRWKKNIVTWIGAIQPTRLSNNYTIKIIHQLHRAPNVYVLKPQLTNGPEGETIPHTYPENRLCLYHPRKQEWSQQMRIAETILPWASLWLFYYEIWQATGEWLGGGEHPDWRRNKRRSLIYHLNCLKTKARQGLG